MFLPAILSAQLISLKTVPVATGDQFLLFPSQNLGMGGISVALDDTLHDPFVNPAKGCLVRGISLFSSPMFYRISERNGAARTLPLGILFGAKKWFGSLSLSIQQLDASRPNQFQLLSDKSSNNMYAFGSVGAKLSDSNTAIGASLFWASLNAMEGVGMLYSRSEKIEQFGNQTDFRMGLLTQWKTGRAFEAVLIYNHLRMTHDVDYPVVFLPFDNYIVIPPPWTTRTERNLDHSNTWGIHVGYKEPIPGSIWCIGGVLTGNWKSHPKIPNYEIMNIPRDPGNSKAYNIGVGLSCQKKESVFGIDVIYEPIWSSTWAEADQRTVTQKGRIIQRGQKTVENDFDFSNWLVRTGFTLENATLGFQMGLEARSIRYWMDQHNYAEEFFRKQHESWMEWRVSLGLILKWKDLQIRYLGLLTMGTGEPGITFTNPPWISSEVNAAYSDLIIAPRGPLTLQEVHILTHQITLLFPIQ